MHAIIVDIGETGYRRFLEGDDEGLTIIIKEYKDSLILYINNYVNNIYVAEDLMQETFFKIAVKKPKFNGKSTFKTWLYAIGRNLAIDYLRKNSKAIGKSAYDMQNYIADKASLESLYIKNERQTFMDVTFLPDEYLCPMDYYTGKKTITNNTYSIHHYSASWTSKVTKRTTRIKRIVGVKMYNKLYGKILHKFKWLEW